MMKGNLRFSSDKMFAFLISWLWTQTILTDYARAVVLRMPIIGEHPDVVMTSIFLIILVFALPSMKIKSGDLLFICMVLAVYALNWCFYGAQNLYLEQKAVNFLLKVLPMFIVGVCLGQSKQREQIIRLMYYLSMITLPVTMFYKAVFAEPMSAQFSKYSGSMEYAYNLLPHLCLIAYFAVKKTNLWNIAFSIIGGLFLMLQGTRGAVLLYLLLWVFLLIMGKRSKGVILRTMLVLGAIAAFYFSPLYNKFILFMYEKAKEYGLSIRIFDKILNNEIGQSSARNVIRETLLAAVAEKPFIGYGLFADHLIAGTYAHNILVELWVDFGVIIGSALFIVIVCILLKGFIRANGQNEKGLILTLIFVGFGHLFLSGSYLDSPRFFLALGFCVDSIRRNAAQGKSFRIKAYSTMRSDTEWVR